jgi:raffinose/stachyose/melibiose transport system permease protein
MKNAFSNKTAIFFMVLPGIAFLLFALIAPIILSVYYGMTDWSGLGKMNFIGLANFKEILWHDSTFWISLFNALLLTLVTVLVQNPFAFIICIALLSIKKGGQLFRTIYFIPAIISIVVTTKLWVFIFNPTYGLLNKALSLLGLSFLKLNWLSDLHTAIWSVIFIVIWQGLGWAVLFYYAGLVGIPIELKEAARIDGANGFKLYSRVVLPLMMPVIKSILIIDLISCFKQMETVFLSTGGGPGDKTQFLANYLYQKAFSYSQYGYGNAISVLFVIICIAGTVILNKLTQQDVGEF